MIAADILSLGPSLQAYFISPEICEDRATPFCMTLSACSCNVPWLLIFGVVLMPSKKSGSASTVARSSGANIVDRVIDIAPSPLLPGEAKADYVAVAAHIVAVAQPKDAIEEFLTRDVVDLTWEILRLRRLKVGLLRASMGDGVRKVIQRITSDERMDIFATQNLAANWAGGDKSAQKEVASALQKAQLTMQDVMGETLAIKIDYFWRNEPNRPLPFEEPIIAK